MKSGQRVKRCRFLHVFRTITAPLRRKNTDFVMAVTGQCQSLGCGCILCPRKTEVYRGIGHTSRHKLIVASTTLRPSARCATTQGNLKQFPSHHARDKGAKFACMRADMDCLQEPLSPHWGSLGGFSRVSYPVLLPRQPQ